MSRGTRPYNEDTYQAGVIELPAFAKKVPISLNRSGKGSVESQGADSASGDPQVFYFGVFDGHGGTECSDFLRESLHEYVEGAARDFELGSSLEKAGEGQAVASVGGLSEDKAEEAKSAKTPSNEAEEVQQPNGDVDIESGEKSYSGQDFRAAPPPGDPPLIQEANNKRILELEEALVKGWKKLVGGYFRRFKPAYFSLGAPYRSLAERVESIDKRQTNSEGVAIEEVLTYAFLRADLDFVTAQASKVQSSDDLPLNHHDILHEPSKRIGGPKSFKGGSTGSIALLSTPTPTPFWHPSSPASLIVSHVGDTRILLCSTATGYAVPLTTNHHPSSPLEGNRLRRYAATFVTDSFGEERMQGLANTRAFGDVGSKRIGVSAEPEIRRVELGPAEYSFLVLISDGISGTLNDQEIVDIIKEAKTPEQGARDVVSFATEVSAEGDNATCLVVRLGGWERRGEGGVGSLGTKESRDFRRQEAVDPRSRRK